MALLSRCGVIVTDMPVTSTNDVLDVERSVLSVARTTCKIFPPANDAHAFPLYTVTVPPPTWATIPSDGDGNALSRAAVPAKFITA